MNPPATRYAFYVHRQAPAWRLTLVAGAPLPPEMEADDWTFTRERAAADTNPDVARICSEQGYCLFRLGGTFANLRRDLAR